MCGAYAGKTGQIAADGVVGYYDCGCEYKRCGKVHILKERDKKRQ